MKPCMHLVEISIFFTKSCHRQTYQNYEQPPGTSQNSYFQSHFSVSNYACRSFHLKFQIKTIASTHLFSVFSIKFKTKNLKKEEACSCRTVRGNISAYYTTRPRLGFDYNCFDPSRMVGSRINGALVSSS